MLGVWHFFGAQVDGSGFVKVLPNATVTVRRESDGGLAELESDIDGASPGLDNPFDTGSDGEITFYAAQNERYRIDITDGSVSLTLRHQSVSIDVDVLRATGLPINFGLDASVASNDLTIAVKTAEGDDPGANARVQFPFRSATAGNGTINWRVLRESLSLTVPQGATLGHNSALKQYIYVYVLDNGGTLELAVSFKFFGWHGIASTSGLDDSPGADDGTEMYSETARSNLPFMCVALLESTQAVAGTWATDPSATHLAPFTHPLISFHAHKNGSAQTGVLTGTDTKVTFGTEVYDNGGLFDAATNYRWVPPPGSIELIAQVFMDGTLVDTAEVDAQIFKNNAVFRLSRDRCSGTGSLPARVSIQDECNGTDYYEIWVKHATGSSEQINGLAIHTYVFGKWSPQRS